MVVVVWRHLLPALGGVNRTDLLARVTEQLLTQAGGRRLVLGVDDAHLLDETSTALVHQLAVTGAAFIIVTVRRGAPVPEAITALWKDELAERLEVTPLSRAESHELLSAALGRQVDSGTQHELFELTLGIGFSLKIADGPQCNSGLGAASLLH
jgi:predicted ATPase